MGDLRPLIWHMLLCLLGVLILHQLLYRLVLYLIRPNKNTSLSGIKPDYKPIFDITRNDMYVRNKVHNIHTAREEQDKEGDN